MVKKSIATFAHEELGKRNTKNGVTITSNKEVDPHGKNPHEMGAKMDSGKAPIMQGVLQYFPRAINLVSYVSLVGANKYAWKGWEQVPEGVNRYSDALGRHLLAEAVEGHVDGDTKQLHAAQVAWNALARLELLARELEQEEDLDAEVSAAAHIKIKG